MTDEELSLPKATITKVIKDCLEGEGIRCSNETRDLICECCVEFIQMVASESNEICNKGNKKTISPEHVFEALKNLGYADYLEDVEEAYDTHKAETARQAKISKKKDTGMTDEELLEEQRRLFAQSKARVATPNTPSAVNIQRQQQLLQQAQMNVTTMVPPTSPVANNVNQTSFPSPIPTKTSPIPLPVRLNTSSASSFAAPPKVNASTLPPAVSLPAVSTIQSSHPLRYFPLPSKPSTPLGSQLLSQQQQQQKEADESKTNEVE
jgi:histone H3/H4